MAGFVTINEGIESPSEITEGIESPIDSPPTSPMDGYPAHPFMLQSANSQSMNDVNGHTGITSTNPPDVPTTGLAKFHRSKSEPHRPSTFMRPITKRDSGHFHGEREHSINQSALSTVKKAGKSLMKGLHDLKSATTAEEMIRNLVVDKDGKQIVDFHCLDFEYLEYNPKWKQMDMNEWGQWIYDNFLGSNADIVINISYGNKMKIREHFESDKDTPSMVQGSSNSMSTGSFINGNVNPQDADIFDAAQEEVWKLMANDSFAHFKRTKMVCHISHLKVVRIATFSIALCCVV